MYAQLECALASLKGEPGRSFRVAAGAASLHTGARPALHCAWTHAAAWILTVHAAALTDANWVVPALSSPLIRDILHHGLWIGATPAVRLEEACMTSSVPSRHHAQLGARLRHPPSLQGLWQDVRPTGWPSVAWLPLCVPLFCRVHSLSPMISHVSLRCDLACSTSSLHQPAAPGSAGRRTCPARSCRAAASPAATDCRLQACGKMRCTSWSPPGVARPPAAEQRGLHQP